MGLRMLFVLFGVLAVGAVVIALGRGSGRPAPVAQPIAFNHQIHVERAKLDCTTMCHSAARTETYAGLPSKEVCFECHDPEEAEADKPELTRLAGYFDSPGDILWERVATIAPDVFFSHRRHVASAEIACARCHPGVQDASQPLGRVSPVLPMDECVACHQREGADVDCLACHR